MAAIAWRSIFNALHDLTKPIDTGVWACLEDKGNAIRMNQLRHAAGHAAMYDPVEKYVRQLTQVMQDIKDGKAELLTLPEFGWILPCSFNGNGISIASIWFEWCAISLHAAVVSVWSAFEQNVNPVALRKACRRAISDIREFTTAASQISPGGCVVPILSDAGKSMLTNLFEAVYLDSVSCCEMSKLSWETKDHRPKELTHATVADAFNASVRIGCVLKACRYSFGDPLPWEQFVGDLYGYKRERELFLRCAWTYHLYRSKNYEPITLVYAGVCMGKLRKRKSVLYDPELYKTIADTVSMLAITMPSKFKDIPDLEKVSKVLDLSKHTQLPPNSAPVVFLFRLHLK